MKKTFEQELHELVTRHTVAIFRSYIDSVAYGEIDVLDSDKVVVDKQRLIDDLLNLCKEENEEVY